MQTAKDIMLAMANDFGMLPGHLQTIIQTSPLRYKIFFIPKRNGKLRELAQPAREVKSIQRWIMSKLSPLLPLHESATAYHKGASIKQNALKHIKNSFILKMDFRNFFPSILKEDIVRHLQFHCSSHYDSSAISLIAHTCTWAPRRQIPLRLCIGAPCSPLLSNSIMFDFDKQLTQYAATDGVTYTRYADDLTLSTNEPGVLNSYPRIIQSLVSELNYPRLEINTNKTVFASRAGLRFVTGITLTNDQRLSIGRERKRMIRAMYHRKTLGLLDTKSLEKLAGLIAFAEDIEPGFSAWLKKETDH